MAEWSLPVLLLLAWAEGLVQVGYDASDATVVCQDESPGWFFTWPEKGNSTCFGLCFSSANGGMFDSRVAAFGCEAAIGYELGLHRGEVCDKCPLNCYEACTSPTASPSTAMPSALPTPAPSALPTATPQPSDSPSVMPSTEMPTYEPTAMPTSRPSPLPSTAAPSGLPKPAPTAEPSLLPTHPTSSPTSVPTSVPTATPTAVPTAVPTSTPTPNLKIFITELADPANDKDARFVELYSPTGGSLDGLYLVRNRVTKYVSSTTIELGAGLVLAPDSFLLVCSNKTHFDLVFSPETCDLDAGEGGPAELRGDDS